MKRTFLFGISMLLTFAAAPAWGQFGGREERREERGGREERREERDRDREERREERGGSERGRDEERSERRGFDPSEWLRRMDANGNGQLEPTEVSGRGREFVERAASRAGLDPKQPLSIEKLSSALQEGGERRDERSSREEEKKPPVITSSSASSVAGFGIPTALNAPPGFDGTSGEKSSRYKRPLEERFEKKVIDRVDEMLKQYDDDKNGSIDYKTDEKNDVRWSTPPEESDLNKDNKLDREELCYRIAKILGSRERDSKDSKGGSSSGGESSEQRQKVRRYAEGLLKQYDENKNGVLEKDEWSKMSGDPKRADRNDDGVVTVDELADRLGNYGSDSGASSQTASTGNSGGRFGSSGGGSERSERSERGSSGGERPSGFGYRSRGERESTTEKKSYRMLSPTERLPKGLPSWFTRNDADADGQVTMAEYSTSYNDKTAEEFAKYDHDGDGVITPTECLQGDKIKTTTSSSSGSGSSSSYGSRDGSSTREGSSREGSGERREGGSRFGFGR